MKQNANDTLFDGFNAVGAGEESKEDSEEEIEELTDDEAFDVNAYLPKNGMSLIHCLSSSADVSVSSAAFLI